MMRVDTIAEGAAPEVVALTDPRAMDPAVAGAKAARLAQARRAGLPALPGFVLGTASDGPAIGAETVRTIGVRSAWADLTGNGERPLVVRSSSTVEDGDSSSMAGLFASVVNVSGWREFSEAVEQVLASARDPRLGEPRSMAVLVQPYLAAEVGGVLFGADPISGHRDRLLVAAMTGGPHALVAGTAEGARFTLSRHGRRLSAEDEDAGPLTAAQLRRLAWLARRAAAVFGGPQDIEWAIDRRGDLYLLQSRPLTGLPAPVSRRAPLLGPGPVAETFPDPLSTLEADLWVPPLRAGLVEALTITGAASASRLAPSPVVTVVNGRVAADLTLLDPATAPRRTIARLIDPRPPARRLRAAWRVGRLRAELPALTADLLGEVDQQLAAIPVLDRLSDGDLIALLAWTRRSLAVLHAYEAMAGVLMRSDGEPITAASIALRALARSDDGAARLVEREPVVLTLAPPAVRATPRLPVTVRPVPEAGPTPSISELPLREAARLRIRWMQELGARAAWEAGMRLVDLGVLEYAAAVRHLHLTDVVTALRERRAPRGAGVHPGGLASLPLPATFQLASDGTPVAVAIDRKRGRRTSPGSTRSSGEGEPAGGGRGSGVVHGDGVPEPGSVLVVQTLDPSLAVHLPALAGLIAETGSALSHLAILARELSVPTVVGVPDAVRRFPAGSRVLVDGTSGQVFRLDRGVEEATA